MHGILLCSDEGLDKMRESLKTSILRSFLIVIQMHKYLLFPQTRFKYMVFGTLTFKPSVDPVEFLVLTELNCCHVRQLLCIFTSHTAFVYVCMQFMTKI